MKTSANGRRKLTQWEGCILYTYDDFDTKRPPAFVKPGATVRGTLTIGVGHTGANVKPGMRVTAEGADAILSNDLVRFENAVNNLVKVDLNQNQFDALVAFAFNVGVSAFGSSTLLKKLNKGQYAAVPSELMKWTKSKGKQMAGLVNRRSQEAALWGKGSFVASNFVDAQPTTSHKDVATIGGSGAAGIGASLGPAIPDIADAALSQQMELSSGDWLRISIAGVILALTIYGIYRRIKA